MGESTNPRTTLRFDRRVRLEFHGATITSDAGLLACRELDDALGLTETAEECLQESRGGRNVQHRLVGLLRQSVYSRLAGYEDTNDAERLSDDPAMRVVVGQRGGPERPAASTNTMSRFETEVLTQDGNVEGLGRVNATWVDRAMTHTAHRRVILDMDSSESPVHGGQEGASYNGHFGSTCYHPLFVFTGIRRMKLPVPKPSSMRAMVVSPMNAVNRAPCIFPKVALMPGKQLGNLRLETVDNFRNVLGDSMERTRDRKAVYGSDLFPERYKPIFPRWNPVLP